MQILTAADSTLINAYGFDSVTSELTLVLKGEVNVYLSAPRELFDRLDQATSKGQFYNQVIRKSGLQFVKRPNSLGVMYDW